MDVPFCIAVAYYFRVCNGQEERRRNVTNDRVKRSGKSFFRRRFRVMTMRRRGVSFVLFVNNRAAIAVEKYNIRQSDLYMGTAESVVRV